jgi:hypothetical protein
MGIGNPAGRLLELLSKGESIPSDKKASEAWAELLETDDSDFIDLLRKLGLVQQLPFLVRERIRNIEDFNSDIHLEWIPAIEAAFRLMRLQRPWGDFIGRIDKASLYALKVCDHELSKSINSDINLENIDDLKREASSIDAAIRESSLDTEVSKYLLDNLHLIQQSFNDYQISGPESVREAVQITIGSIAVDNSTFNLSLNSDAGRDFWAFVKKLALLTAIIAETIAIGNFAKTQLLEIGNPTDEQQQVDVGPDSRAVFRNDENETESGARP